MNSHGSGKWIPAAMAILILSGIFAPMAVLGQGGTTSQSQLGAMITAAGASRSYANNTVALAEAHGLSTGTAQAEITQGDSFLATANLDLQMGSDTAAGIAAARAAMSAYASAATSASLALTDANLTTTVDYQAASAAVAEVNASLSVAASAAAEACGSAGVTDSNSSGLVQACTRANAQLTAAGADLRQATSLLAQANGQATASADLSQVLNRVSSARNEVNATTTALLTVSSYGYSDRAKAYVAAFVDPLSAKANATISSEGSALSKMSQLQAAVDTFDAAQASAGANATSAAQSLAAAISGVDIAVASSNITAAELVAGQVRAEADSLLSISGILALPNVKAAVQSAVSSATSFNESMVEAEPTFAGYTQAQIGGFSAYLAAVQSNSAGVQTSGSAYVTSYQNMLASLNVPAVLAIPGVQAVYGVLAGLEVSQSVESLDAALMAETSAMATVQTDASGLVSVATQASGIVLLGSDLLSEAGGVSGPASGFLNSTGATAMAQASDSVRSTVKSEQTFVGYLNGSIGATVGNFAGYATSLSSSAASLDTQTGASVRAVSTAAALLSSDARARVAVAASGRVELAEAFTLFSGQNVSAGVAAIAQASADFQAAVGAGA